MSCVVCGLVKGYTDPQRKVPQTLAGAWIQGWLMCLDAIELLGEHGVEAPLRDICDEHRSLWNDNATARDISAENNGLLG